MSSQDEENKKKPAITPKVTLGSKRGATPKAFKYGTLHERRSTPWGSSSARNLTEDQLKALSCYPGKTGQGAWYTVCDQIAPKGADVSVVKQSQVIIKNKFSSSEMRKLYFRNSEFRDIFSKDDYVWVEGYVCLYNNEYLECQDGTIHIKDEYKGNISQYCISVRYMYILDKQGNRKLASTTVHAASKSAAKAQTSMRRFINDDGPDRYYTYGEALSEHMESKSYNDYDMEDLTYISSKSFERYRKNQNCPALAYSVAICVALELFPMKSEEMIRLSRNVLDYTTEIGSAYRYIIFAAVFQKKSVHDCNVLLMEEGFAPLTEEK